MRIVSFMEMVRAEHFHICILVFLTISQSNDDIEFDVLIRDTEFSRSPWRY